jgi:hypothetical protein
MYWDAADMFAGYIRFEYDVPTTIARFKLNYVLGDTYGVRLYADQVDVWVEGSWDNEAWVVVAAYRKPVLLAGTPVFISTLYKNITQTPYRRPGIYQGTAGIFGIVAEDGVPMANYPVHLYERDNFTKIGSTLSNSDGSYSFNGLNKDLEYCVLAHDPTGPQPKNALVFDRVKPINSLSALNASDEFWHCRFSDPKMGGFFALESFTHGAYSFFYPAKLASVSRGDNNPYMTRDLAHPISGYDGDSSYSPPGTVSLVGTGSAGAGLQGIFFGGRFGTNTISDPANYSELSFEMVVFPPDIGAPSFFISFLGSLTAYSPYFYSAFDRAEYAVHYRTIRFDVDPTSFAVRMALGGANLGTVRATAPLTNGEMAHILVTYKQGDYIKIYVNGVLATTQSLGGLGRIKTYNTEVYDAAGERSDNTNIDTVSPSDAYINDAPYITHYQIGGLQNVPAFESWTRFFGGYGPPPVTSGGVAYLGFLGRVLSDEDVAKFYTSYAAPENYVFSPPALSGYGQEVIADLPTYYTQFSEPEYDPQYAQRSLFGRKDAYFYRNGVPIYGDTTSFADGRTSVYLDGSSAFTSENDFLSFPITVEMMFRCTDFSANRGLIASTYANGSSLVWRAYLNTSRNIVVDFVDFGGSTVSYTFPTADYIALDQRHHLVITADNINEARLAVYIDGVKRGEFPFVVYPRIRFARYTRIGQFENATNKFVGQISDVAFYGGTLSDERIAAHFAASSLAG